MKTLKHRIKQWLSLLLLLSILQSIFVLAFHQGEKPSQAALAASGLYTIYLPLLKDSSPAVPAMPATTIFGSEMNPISDGEGLEKMVDAGASWVRRNSIFWWAVEPVQGGGYNWSVLANMEEEFLVARNNGLEIIVIIHGVPTWATAPPYNYACGPLAASALPAFGDFMYALVQRYSVPPYEVKYWEIWNEPDVDPINFSNGWLPFGCLGNEADADYYGGQDYAAVLQAVYPMVKAANPQAKVLVGGLLLDCDPIHPPLNNPNNECIPSRYLEGVLEAGGKDFFDGVGFHAYDRFTQGEDNYQNGIYGNPGWNSGCCTYNEALLGDLKPVLVAKAQYIRYLLNLYGAEDKFLINTETALLCGGPSDPPGGPGCESDPDSPFEKLKAAYVPQNYAAAIGEGLLANIWYSPIGWWRNTGLLNVDLTPRPAYDAYVLAHNILKNAIFLREINEYTDDLVIGYEFRVDLKTIWVIWASDGKTQTILLPLLPVAAWDELGAPVDFSSGTLIVGELKTIYVDWGP